MEKSNGAIVGCAARTSRETSAHEEKCPGIQKFLRICRHLRGPSQNPRGGLPLPPAPASLRSSPRAPPVPPSIGKVRLPRSPSPLLSARPGPSAAGSFTPRLPFGPVPSTREGKAVVHSPHIPAQVLRQSANDQRALGSSA